MESSGLDFIVEVVCCLTRMANFIPTKTTVDAVDTAKLFIQKIFRPGLLVLAKQSFQPIEEPDLRQLVETSSSVAESGRTMSLYSSLMKHIAKFLNQKISSPYGDQ